MKRAREGTHQSEEDEHVHTKVKRDARTAIDYEAFLPNSQHLQPIWAKALGRVAKGNSRSVRVEVEKGLRTFSQKLEQKLERKESSIDPNEETRKIQIQRDKELAEEEERLTAEAERMQRELAKLARANLQNRNELRAIANLGVDHVDVGHLLDSVPPISRSIAGEEKQLFALREEAHIALVQLVGTATRLGDETTNTERDGKVGRLLAVWQQRTDGSAHTQEAEGVEVDSEDDENGTRKKLAAAFRS